MGILTVLFFRHIPKLPGKPTDDDLILIKNPKTDIPIFPAISLDIINHNLWSQNFMNPKTPEIISTGFFHMLYIRTLGQNSILQTPTTRNSLIASLHPNSHPRGLCQLKPSIENRGTDSPAHLCDLPVNPIWENSPSVCIFYAKQMEYRILPPFPLRETKSKE